MSEMEKTALEIIMEKGGDDMAMDPRTPSIAACNPTSLIDGDPNELLFSHEEMQGDEDDDEDEESLFTDEADD